MQFVISRWTSCLSSNSNMAPKYPIRLSVNFWEAISFRHSNWRREFIIIQFISIMRKTQYKVLMEVCRSNQEACSILCSPAQSVPGNPAYACKAAWPRFGSGRCCPLPGRTSGWQRILSGSSLAPLPGFGLSGWSGSAPAV